MDWLFIYALSKLISIGISSEILILAGIPNFHSAYAANSNYSLPVHQL
jgi:hypothetical protein